MKNQVKSLVFVYSLLIGLPAHAAVVCPAVFEDAMPTYTGQWDDAPLAPPLPTLTTLEQSGFHYVTASKREIEYKANKFTALSTVHLVLADTHPIEIAHPNGYGLEDVAYGVLDVVKHLPRKHIESLSMIRINPEQSYIERLRRQTRPNAAAWLASAGADGMNIYPLSFANFRTNQPRALKTSRHELAHLIARRLFGTSNPGPVYANKMSLDSNSVSRYGDTSIVEDFAEATELYLRTNAGRLETKNRIFFANRFSFLDDVFSDRTPQSMREPGPIVVAEMKGRGLLVMHMQAGVGILLPITNLRIARSAL